MKELPFKMIVETEIEKWRRDTFWEKEPETIAWIDDMSPGEVLYDVGANIGIYTLYAASRGVQVVAFEPVLENYVRLVQNIELNGFKHVIPLYCAVGYAHYGDSWSLGALTIFNDQVGASGSQMGEWKGGKQRDVFKIPIGAVCDMCGLFADHIKIDVDGFEREVLMSGYHDAESYLIEINPPWKKASASQLLIGYTTKNKYNTMTPHSRERRQREGINAENVVFTRI